MPDPRSSISSRTLVRALIVASLVLLIAGAVTPLLTTERFYFFSNTFSLASGIRRLAANQQILLAIVLVLFSFCVPVFKGIVIWLAASGRAASRSLLILADRFGKWSMLEVFVAALLITALKLGPAVDATLHYGAYLLASSVLLSGLASQLLPREHEAGPLFSSSITLTVGAVGGALAATLLIGLLNTNAVSLDAIVGTPESRCIERVLRLDHFYARTSSAQADYVRNMQSIDATACPKAFTKAFGDYVAAWTKLEALDANGDQRPSWLERAGARIGLVATRDDRLEDIEHAWAEVERVARKNGVKTPPK